ncbi:MULTISPECIES: gliding motility protein GldN [unclassified Paraflavitalea]|uniref:type IX secretion system ring protein PorN/GldN n=1 Tax=unclassified Paraflavitalea TaxID=2798305 RepID=UPI003D33B417
MRNRFVKICLLAAVLALGSEAAMAQGKPKRPAQKKTTGKTAAKNNNNAGGAVAPPKDTVPKVVMPDADIKLEAPRPSMRNDYAFERNLVKERTPLQYEHIREDDATYVQRVWREIDVHEKINLPFVYKAEGDAGNQRFIMILLNAIKKGEVTAFSAAGGDDRFTTPITFKDIAEILVEKPKVKPVPDWVNDPDGSKGLFKDSVIISEFNPDATVERYWLKEDWVFDKESSRMYVRILGIAPLKTVNNEDGSFRAVLPAFWVYYPDLRPMLARYEVYNGKNYGARMSWEELFESRMFGSRIIKSTINNPNDLFISSYVKDPILALLEGENIKEKMFNYEQDLWSY